jgi:hypothetical protein
LNQEQNLNVNELKTEEKPEVLASEPLCEESDVPLFLRDGAEGQKCDPQDEKDKSGE